MCFLPALLPRVIEASIPTTWSWASRRIWYVLVGSIISPSLQTTCTNPLGLPCGLCTLLLYAPEMPSVGMGRAVFWVAWARLVRQMSHKGIGDKFPSLVHVQALQPGSPSLLTCFLSTGRVNWLLSLEI